MPNEIGTLVMVAVRIDSWGWNPRLQGAGMLKLEAVLVPLKFGRFWTSIDSPVAVGGC